MALLTVGDILTVQVGCYIATQAAVNTVHFVVSEVSGEPTDQTVADEMDAILAPLYKPLMSSQATYFGVKVSKVFPLPRFVGAYSTSNGGAGTAGNNVLPGQVSGIITFATAFAGPKYRGRLYIPFPDEDDSDATTNRPEGGYVTSLETLADAWASERTFVDGADTINIDPVIFHRSDNTYTRIQDAYARSRWATQRRRSSSGRANPVPPI